ncbi:hypothetical protein [Nitrobacter sp. JJSN]|uniref:hypothetical protein n=1 Tax=Nitrobacter sp. JJSN TaxID=3453033 RepID=UPI003F774281
MTAVIAASTFACAALLSFGWSERGGVSLSVENAQARVGRPLTPVSVAGVARRQNRRAAYGYGAGAVGAGLAGGAIGAAAIAAASPYGYYGGGPYVGTGWGNYDGYGTSGYYGGYANRSYVTGRPTLFPRYYGGYGTRGYYGSYAADGYPGGYYANRSYVTEGPTWFPRGFDGRW